MQRQNRFSVIIFFVVVLSILHSSKARKCYGTTQGESYEEMECPPNMPLCVKYSNKIFGDNQRGCAIENFCERVKDDHTFTECHECNTDLCNK